MDPEAELLRDFLDQQRNHVLGILEGLTDTGSGLTCAPQAVTASPAALATLTAALMSRSSHTPHRGHRQVRTW